jgi:hypothetical protein
MLDLTKVFRVYARYRYAQIEKSNPQKDQEKILLKLLGKAKDTAFGKDHNFTSISSVSDFQKKVPLRRYEDFWDDYWKKFFPVLKNCTWPGTIPYFCLSSGTTSGTTKYIPYTREMIKSNSKAGLDMLIYHLINRPQSRIFGGKSFVLGGTTELQELAPGIFGGDLSGIAAITLPWWAKFFYFPPQELALIKNWEEKIDVFAAAALNEDIRSLNGVPSWMLILLQKMKAISGKNSLKEMFPNLELLVHGGVNFEPYYRQFLDLLSGTGAELREVYPASEGFIGSADKAYGQGIRINSQHDIFYEFVPLEDLESEKPVRHWMGNIECGQDYAVVLTTAAGLWSYVLGDTVKFIEKTPPRLLVTGRTSYFLSAFGEHLSGDELEKAVTKSAEAIQQNVADYSFGALYPKSQGDLGGHLLVIEFNNSIICIEALNNFQKSFEKTLCELNEDYSAHFAGGYGLQSPKVRCVSNGTFASWMKKRGKLGGQNKVPRIISNQELFQDLMDFTKSFEA